MAFLNTQTIFNLFITLVVGAALYYYIKYKFRVLELTQREQAKVLQSVIMSMNNTQGYGGPGQYSNDMRAGGVGGHMLSSDLSDINQDIERFKQVNNEELIDVSDDDEDEDDSDSESGSSDGDSESGSSDSESDEESHNTKKIIIGGNIESQTIEHLTGPDVKVIELSHPLYPSQNGNNEDDEDDDDVDDDDVDDDDEDDEDDDSSENGNGSGNGNNTANIEEVTSTLNGVEYLEILDNDEHKLKTDAADAADAADETDEISIKTVFKNKESDTHAHNDFNGMNVQSLRQLYKQRLLTEGKNMSEAAIGKLTKKELIKNLQQ